jgi:hypothetical protein
MEDTEGVKVESKTRSVQKGDKGGKGSEGTLRGGEEERGQVTQVLSFKHARRF